jgi:hypothetical protein
MFFSTLTKTLTPYIYIGLVVGGGVGGWFVNGWRLEAEIEQINRQHAEAVVEASRLSLLATRRMQDAANETVKQAQQQAKANAVAATGARRESDRLRQQIAASGATVSSSTRPALDAYTQTLGDVFSECVREYSEVAGKADSHALDASILFNAWQAVKDSKK